MPRAASQSRREGGNASAETSALVTLGSATFISAAFSTMIFRKLGVAAFVGLLAFGLTACGSSSSSSSRADGSDAVAENVRAAISAVDGVVDVTARYSVNAGMGSTAHVRITAESGTESLETVMNDSLVAFAGASDGIKSTTSVSIQVTEDGQENSISPDAIGLQQSPTAQEISDFAYGG